MRCYSNTCANNRLIKINKFVSRITDDLCNLFYYYCQTLLRNINMTPQNFSAGLIELAMVAYLFPVLRSQKTGQSRVSGIQRRQFTINGVRT
jgi:hypothetical protein